MMKRCLSVLLSFILLLPLLPASAEEPAWADILTGRRWISDGGNSLTLNADGTGVFDNGMPIDGAWSLLGTSVTFSYQLYGARSFTLVINELDGDYLLISPEGTAFYSEELWARKQADQAANSRAYPLAWDEEVRVGFASMKLSGFQACRELRSPSGVGLLERDTPGSKYLTATGTISNQGGASVNRYAISVQVVVDGQYTYDGLAMFENNGSLDMKLPAAASGKLYLYAQVPDEIALSFREAKVLFGFNDQFKTNPGNPEEADFCFALTADEALSARAKQEPPKEKTYFEESPSLPVPTSYADVKQSGRSSSKSNGKVTKIEYRYRLMYDSDQGEQVFAKYIEGLRADGYRIETSGGSYVISNGNKKIATVSFDSAQLTVNVTPGNEKLTVKPAAAGPAITFGSSSAAPREVQIPTVGIGDTIKTPYLQMSLAKYGKTSQLLSYVSGRKPRNWRYYEPNSSASQLFYVQGTFTNLTNREVNINNICAELIFDGNETYRCTLTSLYGDGRGFTTTVISKDKVNFYIYAEVPKSILNQYKTCEIKLGFTQDFSIKHVSNGSLLYEYCDDVYILKIK